MKKTASLFAVLIALLLLTVPTFARSKSELQKVYNTLNQYLHTPFYKDSEYFAEYNKEFNKTAALLTKEDPSEEEIDRQYSAIKSAYANLLKSTFDYSPLSEIIYDFEKLSLSLYTEDSWRTLSEVMDKIYGELEAPTLFKKGNNTKESYAKEIEGHIQKLTDQFDDAYNGLVMVEIPENLEKDQLLSVVNYCTFSAQESLMGKSFFWNNYLNMLDSARSLTLKGKPDTSDLSAAAVNLLDAYHKLSDDVFDYSIVENEMERFRSLSSNQYTQSSWDKYSKQIEILSEAIENPLFPYLKNKTSIDGQQEKIQAAFSKLTKQVDDSFNALILQEDVNYLSALCNTYAKTTASKGLEVKLKNLLDSVSEGNTVLENENATQDEIHTVIEKIEEEAKSLDLAEKYLKTEQNNNVQTDVSAIQTIILFTVATLILSFVFAAYISYKKMGGLLWS